MNDKATEKAVDGPEGGDVSLVVDVVSDERAWCMFAAAFASQPGMQGVNNMVVVAERADGLLAEFKTRFRPEGEDEDDDDAFPVTPPPPPATRKGK